MVGYQAEFLRFWHLLQHFGPAWCSTLYQAFRSLVQSNRPFVCPEQPAHINLNLGAGFLSKLNHLRFEHGGTGRACNGPTARLLFTAYKDNTAESPSVSRLRPLTDSAASLLRATSPKLSPTG